MAALGAAVLAVAAAQAQAARPANDNRAAALATAGSVVNLTANNVDATTEAGEVLTCADPADTGIPSSRFDSTVWFTYDPPAAGTVTYTVAGGAEAFGRGDGNGIVDTVLWLYDAAGNPSLCDDDFTTSNGLQSSVSVFYPEENPGPRLVQVGGYDDRRVFEQGLFNYSVVFSKATRVSAFYKQKYVRFRKFTVLKRAQISVEPGTTTIVKCRGGGCKKRTRVFTSSPVPIKKMFKKGTARKGAKIEAFVTEPLRYGYYLQIRFRGAKNPARKTRCLAAGVTSPTRADISPCPS